MHVCDFMQMGRELMDTAGLRQWTLALHANRRHWQQGDWRHRSSRSLGLCWYSLASITLRRSYVRVFDEKTVTNTLKHEIAHAIVGMKHGHGTLQFESTCLMLGCTYAPYLPRAANEDELYFAVEKFGLSHAADGSQRLANALEVQKRRFLGRFS